MRFSNGVEILNKSFKHEDDAALWSKENPEWEQVSDDFTISIKLTSEQKIQQLESERDRLLKGTDWYAVRMLENGTDIPVDISEYRNLLRAIDELEGYPDIELPEQPEGIKFVY